MPTHDQRYLERAIRLALAAERDGNLPVGAVLVLDDRVLAEAGNALLEPDYDPGRHAEIEAIRRVPTEAWPHAARMTCYTTLEPCLMCFGALLLHGVGRVVFGARDPEGGAGHVLEHLPPFYDRSPPPRWEGPLDPERCDPLFNRTLERFLTLPCSHPDD